MNESEFESSVISEVRTFDMEYNLFRKKYYTRYYLWTVIGLILLLVCNVVGYFATGFLKYVVFTVLLILCGFSVYRAFRNHEKVIAKRFRKYQQKGEKRK